MTKLDKIVAWLDRELEIDKIKDDSYNGLQFEGKEEVKKIGYAVDASLEAFEKAKKSNVDFLLVHHGMLWKSKPIAKFDRFLKQRIAVLVAGDISLYACHLPLDKHKKFGNNAQLSKFFDLKDIKEFAEYHGTKIGYYGELRKPTGVNEFAERVRKTIGLVRKLAFGPKRVRKLGIVSGGGYSAVFELPTLGIDTLLTGEYHHATYHWAKERGVNVIAAGHYATEIFGVKALAEEIKRRFKVEAVCIDVPTGM